MLLSIDGLSIAAGHQEIVHDVSLHVSQGEVHAIMGPNGSGKSTLVNVLTGHPSYRVTGGTVRFCGEDLLAMTPDERARQGLFLALQHPRTVEGVSLRSFLFAAHNAQAGARTPHSRSKSPIRFQHFLEEKMRALNIDPVFAERVLNQGFSGGEKKKAEVLQLMVLRPLLALLDETDSGLDVDALKIVAEGINSMRDGSFSAVLVTHYVHILQYIHPDHVHIMVHGRLVESGGPALAAQVEREGFARFLSGATS